MVFSSMIFVFAFLPLCMACYFSVKSIKAKNIVLLVFSLVFYAWGEPVYVVILVLMSFFCWLFSLGIGASSTVAKKRVFLVLACAVCIGSIGWFKYSGFLAQNINALIGRSILPVPQLTLPIGISFYTFQLLTYVVDVYREDVPPQKKFYYVLLYAGLFHQCIAGPIVRYGDIENELTRRTSDLNSVSRGITRFACGLAKKSVLANGCGAVADMLLLTDAAIGNSSALSENIAVLEGRSGAALLFGMIFYMLQIYLDFSAYSDMAIGMGLVCGFHFKENFDYPYISTSVTEFWRRWHISLGSFFRDYVYIPLGGNRKGKGRQIFNLFVVWTLTGLWHGASWNFVLWGLYFFVLLVLEKLFLGKLLEKNNAVGHIYLIVVVYFGWVFFKFTDMSLVSTFLRGIFLKNDNPFFTYESKTFITGYIPFLILCIIACLPVTKLINKLMHRLAKQSLVMNRVYAITDIAVPVVLLLVSAVTLVGDSYNPFLYFNF